MIEWDVIFRLVNDLDQEIRFNDPGFDYFFALEEESCRAERTLRVTTNPIPQADGEILHRRFRDGTEITLAVQLWETSNEVACGRARREMHEMLVAVLDGMLNAAGRLYWQPSSYPDERMLDSARKMTPIEISYSDGVPVCTFTVDSPFPYVLDKTQREDSPASGGLLVPAGVPTSIVLPEFSAPFWPVMKAFPNGSNTWSIINTSVEDEWGDALGFFYDVSRPHSVSITGEILDPHYAEIDTFRETIYYDGNLTNLKPFVNPETSDYFYLQPGSNLITATDADVLFLINNAWAVS